MKHTIGSAAALALGLAGWGLAACGATQEGEERDWEADVAGAEPAANRGTPREASMRFDEGYVREIDTRGTVVDAVSLLLRGDRRSRDAGGGVLALDTPEGVLLVLPPGRSSSDDSPRDPDPVEAEQLAFDLGSLEVGERVRVSGELYRRGGLQGIEVESIERE